MLLELCNATIVDPLHSRHGQCDSLFVRDGRFVAPPRERAEVAQQVDVQGDLVLAGGIDIHTHIGGGKVNLARLLMPAPPTADSPRAVWPTVQTGERYSQMGYTACFEPAMLLSTARHTHLELADTPHLDTGAYIVVGNEDWLLHALGTGLEDAALDAYIGWTVAASQALAVKVVNAGGISAFKYNQRALDVDQRHAQFGVTPREMIGRLSASIERLGLAHPLHVHASNLGVPGNVDAALATLAAADGHRIHLTHAQFNSYSAIGPYGMGSGAERLAAYVNAHSNVTLDIGQIVFGQTVTISADTVAQFSHRRHAHPARWVVSDSECQAGCGVVPMRYQDKQYVHSLQWTIGLELMLLIEDPWRVFLTTDYPNGGPFTSYPHLLRLLMDHSFRQSMLETIHPQAAKNSLLQELTRELTLDEVAIMTRAAPAKILGLTDRGTLSDGALADLAIYHAADNWQTTFSQARRVMKSGQWIEHGEAGTCGRAECHTLRAAPEFDRQLVHRKFSAPIEQALRMPMNCLEIGSQEMQDLIRRPLVDGPRIVAATGQRGAGNAD
ncbi:MAG: formylmethanofuran dehydrogenase subunit A [Planctomycetales bacterium]|nr:formylmethanofuran dehydrogenase subunit A [Planctomycetales bacterium]